ncbi:hypothetical protein ZOSMA_12G00510 [Zostera marina]|uniref:Phytocyanin domain-containing protein n=1 Tax=Zostera marina TaxID=29655 RepID=A0A0K9Q1F7_ZOSMR|nr:hypothetical protein ZOSMA_12G00510 [Zostera marina]
MTTSLAILMMMMALSSGGEVYKVGDSDGWTELGSPNYTAWTVSKTFQVGDIILFEYKNSFHDVLEVSKEDYKSCNVNSPLASYTSGNDSVPINRRGHHFFVCGKPGHCHDGQKVDIRIPKLETTILGSPSPAPTSVSAPTGTNTRIRKLSSAGGLRLWPLVALLAILVSIVLFLCLCQAEAYGVAVNPIWCRNGST